MRLEGLSKATVSGMQKFVDLLDFLFLMKKSKGGVEAKISGFKDPMILCYFLKNEISGSSRNTTKKVRFSGSVSSLAKVHYWANPTHSFI